MVLSMRRLFPLIATAGVVLALGASSWADARKERKISVGDDPSMKEGSPGVVLVEVSDFECPYCGQGAREVMPKVHEKYVRTGKVELIFLDLPLEMHPHAFQAAEAAACAGEQKKFWEMHDVLFANQRALAPDQLPGYAEKLGLDVAAFQKCVSSGQQEGAIREDMKAARDLGINGTPAYLIGRRIPESDQVDVVTIVGGLPPYEELEKRIEALLASK